MKEFPWWGYIVIVLGILLFPLTIALVTILTFLLIALVLFCMVFNFEVPDWICNFMNR